MRIWIKKLNKIFRENPTFLAGLILLGITVLLLPVLTVSTKRSAPLQDYADNLVKNCAKTSGHNQCYNEDLPKLMATTGISMEDAFQVIRLIQSKDDGFWYCHVASHLIVAKEIDRNPANWKEVLTRCPGDMCSNGCIHGAFQERFKTDVLPAAELPGVVKELKDVCEPRPDWEPPVKDLFSCYHGIGHTAMYLTGADVNKSTEICKTVALKPDGRNYLQTCIEGIFMQLYQPREPEDVALVKSVVPKVSEITKYCARFTNELIGPACYRESWALHNEDLVSSQGIINFCTYFKNESDLKNCYDKMFGTIMTLLNLDVPKMERICQEIPLDYRAMCFAVSAGRLVTADRSLVGRAVKLCQDADALGLGQDCFTRLADYGSYVEKPHSDNAQKYCNELPDNWRKRCLN